MPLANQYGLDMGNILSQSSNIKTARLNRRAKQLEIDKEEAGNVLRRNALNTNTNALNSKEAMTEKGIEGPTEKPIDMLPQEEVNRLSSIAPIVASDIQKQQKAQAHQQALKKMYVAQGESEDVADYKSSLDIKDVLDIEKHYQSKDKITQQNIRNVMSQQGKFVQSMLETAQKNPQRANEMYQSFRTDKLKEINELRKNGKNEQADMIEKTLTRSPESLISSDGKFNASYLHLTLGKLDSMLTTAESYQKEQESEKKQENALELQQVKANIPRGTEKEFQQLMNLLETETDPTKKKKIEARLTKLSQPSMTSLLTNMNTVKEAQSNFAQNVGLDSPYKLATVDTRKWTPEQQAEGNQVASIIIKGLGANAKEAEKKMGEFGALSEQMKNAISGYENVGNFRAADETVKQYFSNYFGLSKKELESTEAAQAFQSMLNIKIKADSGSAVSGNEMVRNTLETASPFMAKEKILLGIKNVAKRQIGTLESLKKVMGPVAFNLKYGNVLRNYEDIAKATDTKEVKKADSGFISVEEIIKPSYQEGATATNPTTKQKMIFRNGNWEAL